MLWMGKEEKKLISLLTILDYYMFIYFYDVKDLR